MTSVSGGVSVGISGFASYLPPYRVDLRRWCGWTDESWDKIRAVVGHAFRMIGPGENVYTMAATAVMRLIRQYDIDASRVAYLALGTESSTDNSAGAVIVKGLVNAGLEAEGRAPLARSCEVPEFKHACLGGVYGVKNALRYLAFDGQDKLAIVVCADIAEYARDSSGEPTQGAGAVALLLENGPRLLEVDLIRSGSSSDYRGPDFRKPFSRYAAQDVAPGRPLMDFPVFNGKYSTTCYIEEVLRATEDLFRKIGVAGRDYLDRLKNVFLHRPYHRMPETGLGMAYLYALAIGNARDREHLAEYCRQASVSVDDVLGELNAQPNVYRLVEAHRINDDIYPKTLSVLRVFRTSNEYSRLIGSKLALGSSDMMEVGNLYTAALPAWLAAGLDSAATSHIQLAGEEFLAIGYGSGDAAEAIPMRVVHGWEEAASKIEFRATLAGAVDLDQAAYERLHERRELGWSAPGSEFLINHIGTGDDPETDDLGIEYYDFVGSRAADADAVRA